MARTAFFSIILHCLLAFNAVSQSDTFFMKFNEALPLWEHLVIDPASQGQNITLPEKCILNAGILYCLSGGTHPSNGDLYGYILQALDLDTGDQMWSSENTYFTNDTMQLYVKNICLRPDGDIELLGAFRLDSLVPDPGFFDLWYNQGPSAMFRRTIDHNDGSIIITKEGKDTLLFYGLKMSQFMYEQDSTYLAFADLYIMDTSQLLKFGLVVSQLDLEHTSIGSPIDTLSFETEDTLTYFSMEVFSDYMQIDSFTFAVPFFQNRLYFDYKAQLIIFNTQDLSNIEVFKRIDITEVVPQSPNATLVNYRNYAKNNQLVLTHDYTSFIHGEKRCFLTWFNTNGDVISFYDEIRRNDHYYLHSLLIHADEDRVLVAGFPSYKNSGKAGFDILMGLPGEDTLRYINSITTNAPYEEFPTIRVLELMEGDKLIVGGTVRRNEGQTPMRRQAFYCFDAKALGIDTITSTNHASAPKEVHIYPNPFERELVILNPSLINIERVEMYDQIGRQVMNSEWCGDETCAFSTSMLPTGMYTIILLDGLGQRKIISQAVKIMLN